MYKSYDNVLEELRKKNFQQRIDRLAAKYKDKKIIIYGAGVAFDVIFDNFETNKLNIIGVSDIKFKDGDEYRGYKTIAPTSIPAHKPDIVLITMYDYEIAGDYFKKEIIPVYGKFKYTNFIKFSVVELVASLF